MLPTEHDADALAYRARGHQLAEHLDLRRIVTRARVGERGHPSGGELAAEDARARLGLGGGHERKFGSDPFLHPDYQSGRVSGRVFDDERSVGGLKVGLLDSEGS